MNLEISDYYSIEIDDVWNWIPEKSRDVWFRLEISISEKGEDTSFQFYLKVATPEGLRHFLNSDKGPAPERALLIMTKYSWDNLLKRLSEIVDSCAKDSWKTSIECLQKHFIWEFEDYRGAF